MIVSISRQLLVLIPTAYIMAKLIGINGVWFSFIIAEAVGLAVSLILFIKVYKTRIKPIGEKEVISE